MKTFRILKVATKIGVNKNTVKKNVIIIYIFTYILTAVTTIITVENCKLCYLCVYNNYILCKSIISILLFNVQCKKYIKI